MPEFEISPANCTLQYEASIPAAIEDIVTVSNNRTFTILTSNFSLAGTYEIYITSLTPSGLPIDNLHTTITLTLIDPCEPPSISLADFKPPAPVNYTIGTNTTTIHLPTFQTIPTYCSLIYSAKVPDVI